MFSKHAARLVIVAPSLALAASGCICACPDAGTAAAVDGAPATDGAAIPTKKADVCSGDAKPADDGLIADLEDGGGQIAQLDGRGGYWWSAQDDKGSRIENKEDLKPVEGGVNGSLGMHAHGSTASEQDAWGINFGATFMSGRGDAYDASKYVGISFKAKVGEDSTKKVRFKVGDVNTHADAGQCKACWNHFGKDLSLTTDWKEYQIFFAELAQAPGWGDPRPESIAVDKLVNIDWSIGGGGPFDIWVDDIHFLTCP
jgi:hypothetical protein